MLEQLQELLDMQRALDDSILKENGLVYDERIAYQNQIALWVELGEMLNEFPTEFKHWKKTARDNREKGLEEFVDCLHFQLSLMNYYGFRINEYHEYNENKALEMGNVDLLFCLEHTLSHCNCYYGLSMLFEIGNYLGFAWEEIYQAYMKKNKVNYERLKNGY